MSTFQQAFDEVTRLTDAPGHSPHEHARRDTWQQFCQLPWPTRHSLGWQEIDLPALNLEQFQLAPNHPKASLPRHAFDNEVAYKLSACNGYARSAPKQGALGLRSGLLAELSQAEWSFLIPPKHISWLSRKLIELNHSLSRDAQYLIIPPRLKLSAPIHIHHHLITAGQAVMSQPRSLIICGEGAEVKIIESYSCEGDARLFVNSHTECLLGRDAKLEHLTLHQGLKDSLHFHTNRSVLQGNSQYRNLVSHHQGHHRHEQHIELSQAGASVELLFPEHIRQSEQNNKILYMHHQAPHCQSAIQARSILSDRAKSSLTGRIVVDIDAQKTQADLSHDSLLSSDKAQVASRPELEIYADDVRCSHGTTVGQMDENTLAYMRQRGIAQMDAEALLMQAFLQPIYDAMPAWPLSQWLAANSELAYESND